MRLKGKVALLTGIGTGMGRSTALLFAKEGAKLVIAARQSDHLLKTAAYIQSDGGEVSVVTGDGSIRSEAEKMVESTVSEYKKIDILYVGAGGNFEPDRKFSDIQEHYWNQTLKNTISSMFNLSHVVREVMQLQGGGAIINIAASNSVRQDGNAAYGAAKSGVVGLSINLARELYEDNIRVNVIAAGLIRGDKPVAKFLAPPKNIARTGYPQDIAYAAVYLASDESSWITGQVLAVDGGVDAGTRHLWAFEG